VTRLPETASAFSVAFAS